MYLLPEQNNLNLCVLCDMLNYVEEQYFFLFSRINLILVAAILLLFRRKTWNLSNQSLFQPIITIKPTKGQRPKMSVTHSNLNKLIDRRNDAAPNFPPPSRSISRGISWRCVRVNNSHFPWSVTRCVTEYRTFNYTGSLRRTYQTVNLRFKMKMGCFHYFWFYFSKEF